MTPSAVVLPALLLVAAAPAVQPILVGTLTQGGVVRVTLPAGSQAVTLDGKPVAIDATGRFPIGFGRDSNPTATLYWQSAAGTAHSWPIAVAPRQWPVQSLPKLPPRPVPDAEFERRRPAELASIAAARTDLSGRSDWQDEFYAPVDGPITGIFGAQRILSGQPQAPHAGMDFAAATGTPVKAPAGGTVRLAQGPFTLEGNLVMIDHGAGLVSALLHLSRLDVKAGDVVNRGQVVGAVGKTGRATGPHLHWSLTWTDVRVDPASVLTEPHPFE